MTEQARDPILSPSFRDRRPGESLQAWLTEFWAGSSPVKSVIPADWLCERGGDHDEMVLLDLGEDHWVGDELAAIADKGPPPWAETGMWPDSTWSDAVHGMGEPTLWWWLSFADANLPEGEQFLGVVLLEAAGMVQAIARCTARGINPGGEVVGHPCPLPAGTRFRPDWCERLLSKAEALAAAEDDADEWLLVERA